MYCKSARFYFAPPPFIVGVHVRPAHNAMIGHAVGLRLYPETAYDRQGELLERQRLLTVSE